MVAQVLSFYSSLRSRRAAEADFAKDDSLNHVLAFAALGMFATVMALALGMDVRSS